MKFFLTAQTVSELSSVNKKNPDWVEVSDVSLDGYFYDHLCLSNGDVVGVRYWVDEAVRFDRHPVFKNFDGDQRFKFNQADRYVDFVFDKKDIEVFQNNLLKVHTVQDFGGESVFRCGENFGFCFSL
jgi:hypothetical protein